MKTQSDSFGFTSNLRENLGSSFVKQKNCETEIEKNNMHILRSGAQHTIPEPYDGRGSEGKAAHIWSLDHR